MGTRLQVVAAMAVVGSVAGGGVALAHVPAVQQTAATASQPSDPNGQTLQSLLEQSAKLHTAIESAREGLAQAGVDDGAVGAASPDPSTSADRAAADSPGQSQDVPALSAPPTASTTLATGAPTTSFADDDGTEAGDAEAGGHEDGREAHESQSTRTGDPQPAPTRTRAPGGGDD